MIKDFGSAIIFSLAYTHQFQYPLTKEEIFLRLVGNAYLFDFQNLAKELSRLVSGGKILTHGGFFFLKGGGDFVETRLKRRGFSQKKWLEVNEFVNFVKHVPWINGVAVTGSLAVDNAKKNDDVDFLIITQKERLWLTRVLVAFFVFIKGKKRSWNKDEENSWCLNLWLDDKSLKLPKRLENIYGAFEISQAVWVYDKNNTKKRFFKLNSWARKFLPNYFDFQQKNKAMITNNESKKWPEKIVENFFFNILNMLLFLFQYLYMKPHMTKEIVNIDCAFFHPRDTKRQIFGKWLKKYREDLQCS